MEIKKKYWENGYSTEVACILVDKGIQLNKIIVARAMTENLASICIMKKAGLQFVEKFWGDYEPHSALTDNADGLSFYRRFAEQFDNLLKRDGILILEFGINKQKDDIERIFKEGGLKTKFFKDLQNKWRVVEVRR